MSSPQILWNQVDFVIELAFLLLLPEGLNPTRIYPLSALVLYSEC